MEFQMTKEQRDICDAVKDMCEQYLNENVFEEDASGSFNRSKWERLAQLGMFSLPFDEQIGGLGADMMTTALAIRSLAKNCKDEGLVFSVCAQLSATQIPLWIYGTQEQKQNYLVPLIDGSKIGASVISEPGAGSDLSQISTAIYEKDNRFTLQGIKTFATLAPVSDILLVYGKHPEGIRMLDISAFLLNKGEYKIGQEYEKSGLRTSPMSEVLLDNVSVEKDRLLGPERRAMNIFMDAMIWEKILVSAYHVGAMEQQYENVYQYANQRKQFGQKIIQFESVYNKLIDMRMRIETSQLMLFHTCQLFDEKRLKPHHAAMLKLHTAESKLSNSLDAVNTMGAYGIIKESMEEKQMRDSLLAKIYSGTSEMQKRIIVDNLGDLYE